LADRHKIVIDGASFFARSGDVLLDAALRNGVDIPYDCRAGHCGTCCVRLVSGAVHGGHGVEPGIIHCCQARAAGDVVIERRQATDVRMVDGVVTSLRHLSSEVIEVGIATNAALPHHAGQYAHVRFNGYPSRPFSITHPLRGSASGRSVWFHMRRMPGGKVTSSLGRRIKKGHRATLSGPFGAAHFRPNLHGRLILVATNTGFAPIWSIAVAALREDPGRPIVIVAGGRTLEALYMGPALVQLSRFPNVRVVAVCSTPQRLTGAVLPGRPTDYLPHLQPSDVVYACGAPAMVDAIKAIAATAGAVCFADPFLPANPGASDPTVLGRAKGWLSGLADDRSRLNRDQPMDGHRRVEPAVRHHSRRHRA
jgi:3-phenylpropionate/trans-cinnamate dioxygenase ferredoxin reductase subunit